MNIAPSQFQGFIITNSEELCAFFLLLFSRALWIIQIFAGIFPAIYVATPRHNRYKYIIVIVAPH